MAATESGKNEVNAGSLMPMRKWDVLNRISGLLAVTSCEVRDFCHTRLRKPGGIFLNAASKLAAIAGAERLSAKWLFKGSRLTDCEMFGHEIGLVARDKHDIVRQLLCEQQSAENWRRRCLVLAEPQFTSGGIRRKGVLLLKFTPTFGAVARIVGVPRVTRVFHVVLEPSWSGYADANILSWGQTNDPVFVQASEERDRRFLSAISTNLKPVDFGSGDWVDNTLFHPLAGIPKRYDAMWVGNRAAYKRLHAFLRAVSNAQQREETFSAALIVGSWGDSRVDVSSLLTYFGLRDTVDVFVDVPYSEMNGLYNLSKSCVLTSLKEGSSRVLFEAMHAGTPIIVLEENVGVDRRCVNKATGRIVPGRQLSKAMLEVASQYPTFSPSQWASENIAPTVTTEKLARALNRFATDGPWSSSDLRVKVNRPEAELFDRSHSLPKPLEDVIERSELAINAESNSRPPEQARVDEAERDLPTP